MKTLMVVFGTRPEAVKLAPLILNARDRYAHAFKVITVVTAQHRQMLDDILQTFGILPDKDLNIMAPGQSLFHITSKIITAMEPVIAEVNPDIVILQGDTTTTFASALCGFYAGKKIAHVEAGLRTGNRQRPFPEEVNRKMASVVADWHFAPTLSAKNNLIQEGYDPSTIHVTGNTVIDALLWMVGQIKDTECPLPEFKQKYTQYSRMVLITGHRRESFGDPFRHICNALKMLAQNNPGIAFVYPVHLNPNIQKPVREILSGLDNFFLMQPMSYPVFCWFMMHCHFIITDSGGVQEEAPALGKPVLVTRSVTERPEAVQEGMVKLVGQDTKEIVQYAQRLIDDNDFYSAMAKGASPYGDGHACERILHVLDAFDN